MHTCEDVQLYSFMCYTDVSISLVTIVRVSYSKNTSNMLVIT
jgi:hypothetical protein